MGVPFRALPGMAVTAALCGLMAAVPAGARPLRGAGVTAVAGHAMPTVTRGVLRTAPAAAPVRGGQPAVPVQILGVRPGRGRVWAAAAHAIRRDALPGLAACATALPGPRGYVHVELSHRETGRWIPEVHSARHDTALEACVTRAAARVVVPPSEDDAPTADLPTPLDNATHHAPAVVPVAVPVPVPVPRTDDPANATGTEGTVMPVPVAAPAAVEDLVAFDLAFGLPAVASRRP